MPTPALSFTPSLNIFDFFFPRSRIFRQRQFHQSLTHIFTITITFIWSSLSQASLLSTLSQSLIAILYFYPRSQLHQDSLWFHLKFSSWGRFSWLVSLCGVLFLPLLSQTFSSSAAESAAFIRRLCQAQLAWMWSSSGRLQLKSS